MTEITVLSLAGKDYLTVAEAAHYACVSERHWRTKSKELGILPFSFMGKTVYRKADIMKAMEKAREWQLSPNGASRGSSIGLRTRIKSA